MLGAILRKEKHAEKSVSTADSRPGEIFFLSFSDLKKEVFCTAMGMSPASLSSITMCVG